jgi:hypothetical protein
VVVKFYLREENTYVSGKQIERMTETTSIWDALKFPDWESALRYVMDNDEGRELCPQYVRALEVKR